MTKVLMVGVDRSTKGGMWSVAENYLQDAGLRRDVKLRYVATASAGGAIRKIACFGAGLVSILGNLIIRRPDVVHLHMSERGSVRRKALIAGLARRFGCKVLIHMHGAEFQTWYESLDERGQRRVRDCLDSTDCILILGGYWRGFISGLVKDEAKIRVLYNAVSAPAQNPYDPHAQNLLFLGEVGERKGVYDLLAAMKRIDAQLPEETRLLLYGPNPEGDIQQRIRQQGLDGRVQYCGWADRAKKAEAFAQTAVNVLPSYHEGLPMTLLEAMAHGIPCITTNVAAIPEAVDEENGVLLQPGDVPALADAILGMIRDADARRRKSAQAHQRVQTMFSMEAHKRSLLQIYAELTEKHV